MQLTPGELADRLERYPKGKHALKNPDGYCCLGVYAHECKLGTETKDSLKIIDGTEGHCLGTIPSTKAPAWMEVWEDPLIYLNHLPEDADLQANPLADQRKTILACINDNSDDWGPVIQYLRFIQKRIDNGEVER